MPAPLRPEIDPQHSQHRWCFQLTTETYHWHTPCSTSSATDHRCRRGPHRMRHRTCLSACPGTCQTDNSCMTTRRLILGTGPLSRVRTWPHSGTDQGCIRHRTPRWHHCSSSAHPCCTHHKAYNSIAQKCLGMCLPHMMCNFCRSGTYQQRTARSLRHYFRRKVHAPFLLGTRCSFCTIWRQDHHCNDQRHKPCNALRQ